MSILRAVGSWLVTIVTVFFFLCVFFAPRAAWAGAAEDRRAAYDAGHGRELRERAPEAVEPFLEASRAAAAQDYPRAIALLEQVERIAPDFVPAMRRRAAILSFIGKRADAIALARRAVAVSDAPENEATLAVALAHGSETDKPTPSELAQALGLAQRAASSNPSEVYLQQMLCEVGMQAQSLPDVRSCADALLRLAPDEPETHMVATIAAASRGDRDEAYASIERARRLGLDAERVDALTRAVDATEPPLLRWGKRLGGVVGAWLIGLALLFALGVVLSKATLRLVRRLSPEPGSEHGGRILRGVYRGLLHVASVYYYASLPLVLFICVAAGGAAILAFFYVGRIPIYLVVVIVSVVAFTIVSVVKSIFARVSDEDPGIPVDLQRHHRFTEVIREVADRVGTRAVDEVYLTPHTEVAVLERGGFVRRLTGRAQRCLVLGVGALDGMKVAPFKAVLAHEYGHFSNRDTAGGRVALSVRRSLFLTAVGLAQRGAATWYNPAWWFFIGFQRIFLRISQGASRLQEVMADRIAAFAYGGEAFDRGLSHVIRRTVEFDAHVNATLAEVVDNARPLANLYRYAPETKPEASEIDEAVKKAFEEEPSPYDSHPKPADRIRWVRQLRTTIAAREDDAVDVWDLFASRAEIEQRLTEEVRSRLAEQGVVVATEQADQQAA
jgi:Zn-dependent protease with chaperone function